MEDNKTIDKEFFLISLIKRINATLKEYFSKFSRFNELEKMLEDAKTLYDETGKPTEEYKKMLSEVEDYVVAHPSHEYLLSKSQDEDEKEVILGISDFTQLRSKLIEDYKSQKAKATINHVEFDEDEWISKHVPDSEDEDRQVEMLNILKDMIEDELSNPLTKKGLHDINS